MDPLDQIGPRTFKTVKSTLVPITIPILILFMAIFSYLNDVPHVLSILLVLVSRVLFNVKEGVEVNLHKMEYRDIYLCFGLSFGRWKKLSELDYLLLSKSNKRSAIPVTIAMSASFRSVYYDIDLITKGDRDVLIFRSASRDKALLFAKDIANELDIRLQEKVSGEFEWII
ncbi:MAG: hypothetical protein KBF42_02710 [Chitinophagales bacterium]|jgi:hypothetical protein|nr:hypothetical protein [Bacteroidota bacterium]MBP8916453.1 hypothetical protein [Chitinophagales bacterium]MBP9220267.1 hypothetical protein [Chitinophagales bacterium]MBP9795693.1 hypothetical protein [Chitinophagales bacterium]